VDYLFFAEQEKAKKAQITKEQRDGVIKNLLDKANKQTDTPVEAACVNERVPAK
jgi:hypothetical protein